MAAPIVDTDAPFAKGSYHSYHMSSDGRRFTGYHHPEGVALRASSSDVIDTNRLYLEVREHNAPGSCRGFYCALRESSFDDVPIGEEYECTFVLVMGVSPNAITSIMQIHYYEWKGDLAPYNNLSEAVKENTHIKFAKKMFKPTLISANVGTVHIKHLAQVSGPTFDDQPLFITAKRQVLDEERTYHEAGKCGDFVSNNGGVYLIDREQELAKNMIRAPSTISNISGLQSLTECNDDVSSASNTSNITQFGLNSPNASNIR